MIDFQPIRDAALTPHDLSGLLGISRVTCSKWLNGHSQPHRLLEEDVLRVIDDVRKAVEADRLPVPFTVTRRERRHYIQTAISEVRTSTVA